MNDMNEDAPFVERARRSPNKWKKTKGDGFANKAKKAWRTRESELEADDLDREIRDYER